MDKLTFLIKKLPMELVFIIISYTYQLQDKYLLNDIKDYQNIKLVLSLYGNSKNWLSNDILYFMNKYNQFNESNECLNEYYLKLFRNPFLQTKEQVNYFIN